MLMSLKGHQGLGNCKYIFVYSRSELMKFRIPSSSPEDIGGKIAVHMVKWLLHSFKINMVGFYEKMNNMKNSIKTLR